MLAHFGRINGEGGIVGIFTGSQYKCVVKEEKKFKDGCLGGKPEDSVLFVIFFRLHP